MKFKAQLCLVPERGQEAREISYEPLCFHTCWSLFRKILPSLYMWILIHPSKPHWNTPPSLKTALTRTALVTLSSVLPSELEHDSMNTLSFLLFNETFPRAEVAWSLCSSNAHHRTSYILHLIITTIWYAHTLFPGSMLRVLCTSFNWILTTAQRVGF